jgi:hypothetical protein
VRIPLNSSNNYFSSATKMSVFSLGEWNDKTRVKTSDKFTFDLYVSSIANIKYLRVDLQVGATQSAFTHIVTSITLSSSAFVASSAAWATVSLPISSFPVPSSWNDVDIQDAPFSRNITYYGIRFVSSATANADLSIDDLRMVQATENPIQAFYLSKQFNLNAINAKDFRQVVLTREKSADSRFSIDVFTDFGKFANKKNINADIPKQIFVFSFNGSTGIAKLNSYDFTTISSTHIPNPNTRDYMNGVADADYLYVFDKAESKMMKLDRDDLSVVVSSFGSLGSKTTSYNTVNQIAKVGDYLYITDSFNNAIKKLNAKTMAFAGSYGEIGTGTTNYLMPTGITCDPVHCWIGDDGNFRLMKVTISTFGYVLEKGIDTNTIGETVLQNDEKHVYAAYNRVNGEYYYQDVILEKRNKGDLSLVQQIKVKPNGVISQSTYTLSGDFALLGPYIFIGFTKDLSTTGTYFIQKRLKKDFSLVSEYITPRIQFSIMGDGEPYKPITESEQINLGTEDCTYIQLKYYDEEDLANTFKLYNYAFALDSKAYEE